MTIEEKAKEYVVKQVIPKIGITMPDIRFYQW